MDELISKLDLNKLKPFDLNDDDYKQMLLTACTFYTISNIFQRFYGLLGITVVLSFPIRTIVGGLTTSMSLYSSNWFTKQIEKYNKKNFDWNSLLYSKSYNDSNEFKELIRKTIFGVSIYLLLEQGFYRTVFPSNSTHWGVFVNTFRRSIKSYSIPSFTVDATEIQRKKIQLLGKRLGCHQCGSIMGKFIADHMPPTKIAENLSNQWWRKFLNMKVCIILTLFI